MARIGGLRWLTLPWCFPHKRARPGACIGFLGFSVIDCPYLHHFGGLRCCREGKCPEWQRELTVNQPSYDFEGSSPSFPTTLRSFRATRAAANVKAVRLEQCFVAEPVIGRVFARHVGSSQ